MASSGEMENQQLAGEEQTQLAKSIVHANNVLTAEELLEADELANMLFDNSSQDNCEQKEVIDAANTAFVATPARPTIIWKHQRPDSCALKKLMYRRLGRNYFRVTDFVQQSWCELKAEYAARHENVTDIVHEVVAPLEVLKPEVKAGREVHKVKELEVAPPTVPVTVVLPQDRKAVYLHNLLFYIKQFVCNTMPFHNEREISVLGALKQQVFVFGQIDELRLDAEKYELELIELKTRKYPTMPRDAQSIGHKMQVMMYANLWNQLLFGGSKYDNYQSLTPGLLGNLWHVNIDAPLSAKCRIDLCGSDYSDAPPGRVGPYTNLRALLAEVRRFGGAAPRITKLTIRYILQQRRRRPKNPRAADEQPGDDDVQILHVKNNDDDAEDEPKEKVIGEISFDYDHQWLMQRLDRFLQAWQGERDLEGVPIEEAWKCQYCEFHDICEWRADRAGGCRKSVIPAMKLNLSEAQKRKLENV